ncbi:NB-ARC domain-containing protein, partial [Geitlerinema splendidum]|nr:NB-ARC domain-containing protein [Geitlerinema splendidum]
MKPQDFLKDNQLLLSGTAILAFGAVMSGHAPGLMAGKLAVDAIALSGFAGNVLAGMTANNIGELVKKLRDNPDILQNNDLARAAGMAIALGIRRVADEKAFPEYRRVLRGLADKTEEYWVRITRETLEVEALSPIADEQIRYAFSANAGEFDRVRVLDEDRWCFVVRWLMQQHGLTGDVVEDEEVVGAIASHLYEHFPKNLREVLTSDSQGEQAFKKMLLDLQREGLGFLQSISERIDNIPNKAEFREGLDALKRALLEELKPSKVPPTLQLCDPRGNLILSPGKLHNVPNLPPKFLPRPEELTAIREKLLGGRNQKLVMTGVSRGIGVQGMGGIGKSVLAIAIAQDEAVRRRFPDGVVWVTVSQTPEVVRRQADIAQALSGMRPYLEDIEQGKLELKQLLADKACLLILDDVWQVKHAEAFDVLGENGQLLLTTRDAKLITSLGAQGHQVGLLSEGQALGLLAQGSGEPLETLPPEAREVARECGYLPLAVAIAGAMICGGAANRWQNVLYRLQTADLEKLRHEFPNYPYPDLLKALQVSIDSLSPEVAARYLDFAIFPEDTPIPEAVLKIFWAGEGLSPYDVEDVGDTLVQRSLAQRDAAGRLTLHDLLYDYVRQQAGDLVQRHQRFLAAYQQRYPDGYSGVEDDGYWFQHLISHHLLQCDRTPEIRELLLNFSWLQAKLEATDVRALLADFELAARFTPALPEGKKDPIPLVEGAIRLSAHVLAEDKTQLLGQLWGRLLSFVPALSPPTSNYRYFWERIPLIGQYLAKYSQAKPTATAVPELETLLTEAKQSQAKPWFRPLTPTFTPPGGSLLRTFSGHSRWVKAVAITPDGTQAVSGSIDGTLKLWDLRTGE